MGLLSPGKLILILVIVLIIFGPGKLPKAGKSFGQMFRNFRENVNEGDEEENPAEDASSKTKSASKEK